MKKYLKEMGKNISEKSFAKLKSKYFFFKRFGECTTPAQKTPCREKILF